MGVVSNSISGKYIKNIQLDKTNIQENNKNTINNIGRVDFTIGFNQVSTSIICNMNGGIYEAGAYTLDINIAYLSFDQDIRVSGSLSVLVLLDGRPVTTYVKGYVHHYEDGKTVDDKDIINIKVGTNSIIIMASINGKTEVKTGNIWHTTSYKTDSERYDAIFSAPKINTKQVLISPNFNSDLRFFLFFSNLYNLIN